MFDDIIMEPKNKEKREICPKCYSGRVKVEIAPMCGMYSYKCRQCGHIWM